MISSAAVSIFCISPSLPPHRQLRVTSYYHSCSRLCIFFSFEKVFFFSSLDYPNDFSFVFFFRNQILMFPKPSPLSFLLMRRKCYRGLRRASLLLAVSPPPDQGMFFLPFVRLRGIVPDFAWRGLFSRDRFFPVRGFHIRYRPSPAAPPSYRKFSWETAFSHETTYSTGFVIAPSSAPRAIGEYSLSNLP